MINKFIDKYSSPIASVLISLGTIFAVGNGNISTALIGLGMLLAGLYFEKRIK